MYQRILQKLATLIDEESCKNEIREIILELLTHGDSNIKSKDIWNAAEIFKQEFSKKLIDWGSDNQHMKKELVKLSVYGVEIEMNGQEYYDTCLEIFGIVFLWLNFS